MRALRIATAAAVAALIGCSTATPGQAARTVPPAGAMPATASAAATAATATALPDHLRGVYDARQLVVVRTSAYGTSRASLLVFVKRADGWHRKFGPWFAWVGIKGFAPRGDKHEGDLRTPSGSFPFRFMFGVQPSPGVRYHYRRALHTSWWDDDSASANYNRWVDSRYHYAGRNPESMYQTPAYRYGVVIDYNHARTPGRGSAIFLHVTHYNATTGCVAIGEQRLVRLLRWLRPSRHPRIIMGTKAAVAR
jgi:L,D-peptidoglycan transpeptidase YkuD (ErfK/YbiS/YcfS/YnhG family)